MAFFLVLGALTILTVMLAEVQDESSAEFSSALSARDAVVAEYAARSAVNLSRLLISTEPTVRLALGPILAIAYKGGAPQIPVWNFTDQMLGAFNDSVGKETFSSFSGLDLSRGKNLGFPGAAFELKANKSFATLTMVVSVLATAALWGWIVYGDLAKAPETETPIAAEKK